MVAAITAAVAFIALLGGVFYNFGYFYSLDLNWFTFLSYKDYLASLVFFVAPVLVLGLIFLLLCKWRYFYALTGLVVVIGLALWWPEADLLGGRFVTPAKYVASFVATGYLIAVILWSIGSANWRALPVASIFLIIFIVLFGNASYRVDIARTSFDTLIVTDNSDQPQHVRILRDIDEGSFLVKEQAPDQIVFMSSDQIKSRTKQLTGR